METRIPAILEAPPEVSLPSASEAEVLQEIRRLEYGEVRVTVCGQRIVQIDATSKRRLASK